MLQTTLALTVMAALLPVIPRARGDVWRHEDIQQHPKEHGGASTLQLAQEILEHAVTMAEQAHTLAAALQEDELKHSHSDGLDFVVKRPLEERLNTDETDIYLQKIDPENELEELRGKRSPDEYQAAMEKLQSAMDVSYAASLSGKQQMDELIKIRNGAPLSSINLPGFPSYMFQPGGLAAVPGLMDGMQMGQQMMKMSMDINKALNG